MIDMQLATETGGEGLGLAKVAGYLLRNLKAFKEDAAGALSSFLTGL